MQTRAEAGADPAGHTKLSRAKARKGAIMVLAAITLVMVMMMLAFVVDLSRLYVQKNELQTGTDAGALAGALQLSSTTSNVADSVVSAANRNYVLGAAPSFQAGAVKCGVWDGIPVGGTTPNTWHAGSPHAPPCVSTDNAVRADGSSTSDYLFNGILQAPAVQVGSRAVAWVAPVSGTSCIRPWAIPYAELTQRIDPTNLNPKRDLTAHDIELLTALPRSALQFNLKLSSPGLPGNFGAVDITGPGGSTYREDIETCSPAVLGPGSVIFTETGNKVGPTLQGAAVLCQPLYGNGACGNGNGGVGIVIKAPLWIATGKINGKKPVTIKIIGSFSLDTVASDASVSGHFLRSIDNGGSIGTAPSLLFRIILVQ